MKATLTTLAVACVAAIVLVLFGVHSGLLDVSAARADDGLSRWLLHTTMENSVERRARSIEVPELDDDLLRAGVNDFDAMCVVCHGAPGQAPGPVGKGLNPAAPDLADSAREMSAAEVFWVTRNGIRMTGMPAWSATHSDDELWPVVALVMALPDLDAAAYASLKARSDGMGHHGDAPVNDHPSESAEHDHSTHDH